MFGCRRYHELCRVRHGDKNGPGRLLGAWPKRKWVKRLQRLGQAVVVRLWREVEAKRPATRSRWQWTWVADDPLFKKDGRLLGLGGPGWSGQEPRVRLGSAGLLRRVVSGDGKLVVAVDVAVRRPDPAGPGGPCRDKLPWLQGMLDRRGAALHRRCRRLPPPLVMADSGFGEAGLRRHVATCQQGLLVVEGKTSEVFPLPEGRQIKGQDLRTGADWPWRARGHGPGRREARLTATNPTDGRVTVGLVDQTGRERYDLLGRETARTAPRLLRAWRRRSWIAPTFRTLKPLLATEAGQMPTEEAEFGHLVLRLMAGLVRLYTARIVFKGRVTREEIVFSVKPHWRCLASEMLELPALSWDFRSRAA